MTGTTQGDLIGWISAHDAAGLTLVDRHARHHEVAAGDIVALRRIPLVSPGRNPDHGDRALLARMLTDLLGRPVDPADVHVARITTLVTDPAVIAAALDVLEDPAATGPRAQVLVAGEWSVVDTAAGDPRFPTLAAWAAVHNARNIAWVAG